MRIALIITRNGFFISVSNVSSGAVEKRVIILLGTWTSHADYQQYVSSALSLIAARTPHALFEYRDAISKAYILNLDPLKRLMLPLYSLTGRPSENQLEIFRSLILMICLGFSLDRWMVKLRHNPVLRIACGFHGKLPGIASYYDFINRLIRLDDKPRCKPKKRKPREKHGKKKLPPKRPGIVKRLVKEILRGRRLNHRPERLLQEIFAKVCVQTSVDLGLIGQSVSISGDGTCIKTGASQFGVKTCDCKDFRCDCPRRFSDPNANWGWDSHKEHWFYGYTGYFISTYNRAEKLDLPLYLRLVDAKRHDSISAVIALAEFRDLYPNLTVENFISDSASDNYATYELLDEWGINAVIALNRINKGNFKYPDNITVDENGVPVCPGGNNMVYFGFCGKDRCRLKWRCPKACGKSCDSCAGCSLTEYGRTVYTKPEWDLSLFTKIPRGSRKWKEIFKERTAAERVNNRILNHYGIENSRVRGKKRISFFATAAGFNIHLDAQLAKLIATGAFDFNKIFGLQAAA